MPDDYYEADTKEIRWRVECTRCGKVIWSDERCICHRPGAVKIEVDYYPEDKLIVAKLVNDRLMISAHGNTVSEAVKELGESLSGCDSYVHEYYKLPYGEE